MKALPPPGAQGGPVMASNFCYTSLIILIVLNKKMLWPPREANFDFAKPDLKGSAQLSPEGAFRSSGGPFWARGARAHVKGGSRRAPGGVSQNPWAPRGGPFWALVR